jgi:hypothetical protein
MVVPVTPRGRCKLTVISFAQGDLLSIRITSFSDQSEYADSFQNLRGQTGVVVSNRMQETSRNDFLMG